MAAQISAQPHSPEPRLLRGRRPHQTQALRPHEEFVQDTERQVFGAQSREAHDSSAQTEPSGGSSGEESVEGNASPRLVPTPTQRDQRSLNDHAETAAAVRTRAAATAAAASSARRPSTVSRLRRLVSVGRQAERVVADAAAEAEAEPLEALPLAPPPPSYVAPVTSNGAAGSSYVEPIGVGFPGSSPSSSVTSLPTSVPSSPQRADVLAPTAAVADQAGQLRRAHQELSAARTLRQALESTVSGMATRSITPPCPSTMRLSRALYSLVCLFVCVRARVFLCVSFCVLVCLSTVCLYVALALDDNC